MLHNNKLFDRVCLSLWNNGMPATLRSLVIATSQIKDVLKFYENLGLTFKTKKVSLGTEYFWTLANGLEIGFLEKNRYSSGYPAALYAVLPSQKN